MDENTEVQPKKNNSMMVIVIIVVLVLVGVGAMLMKNKSQSTQTPETMEEEKATSEGTSAEAPASEEAMTEEGTVKEFAIDAGSFYYKPNEIKVKKDDKVKIVMTSKDMMHNFNIDELNVKIPVTKSGQTNTVEFVADTAGTFEFYCSVGQHRANGQVGTIIVEE